MKSVFLKTVSLALCLHAAPSFSMDKKDLWYWSMNGDPLLAQEYPNQGLGDQKILLNYSQDKANSPGEIVQKSGTLQNSWFRVPSSKEDPTLKNDPMNKNITSLDIPKSSGSYYATSLQTPAQKRAVSIFGTLTNAVIQEYNDWNEIKSLNSNNNKMYSAIVNFQKRDTDQTVIYQDHGVDQNAYYSGKWGNEPSSLNFFHFQDEKKNIIYTGESSDISIHEMGHKRLNDMHPSYFSSNSLEVGGFHEGFGDVYSMLWTARDPSQRMIALKQCKYDLHSKTDNIISDMAEQFGMALGQENGLRNMEKIKDTSTVDLEVHEVGHMWAGGMYSTLADAYRMILSKRHKDNMSETERQQMQDKALYDAATYLARLNLSATLLVTEPNPNLSHFICKMRQLIQEKTPITGNPLMDKNGGWDDSIIANFGSARGIPVQSPSSINRLIVRNIKGLCGTGHVKSENNIIQEWKENN